MMVYQKTPVSGKMTEGYKEIEREREINNFNL